MKKTWKAPQLTIHGSAEAITQKTVAKQLGGGDDLITGIRTIPSYGQGGVLS